MFLGIYGTASMASAILGNGRAPSGAAISLGHATAMLSVTVMQLTHACGAGVGAALFVASSDSSNLALRGVQSQGAYCAGSP